MNNNLYQDPINDIGIHDHCKKKRTTKLEKKTKIEQL
jgi:hypothetical protein